MYIFLGGDISVPEKSIIGVFDMDNTTVSKSTRLLLSRVQKENKVINVTYDLPRSFCITEENGNEKVYISQISPSTIRKRPEEI